MGDDEMDEPPPPPQFDVAAILASVQHDTQQTLASGPANMGTKFNKTFEA